MHQPISQQGLLEDLLAPTIEPWSTFFNSQELTTIDTQLFPIQKDDFLLLSSSSFLQSSIQPDFRSPYTDESIYSSIPCFDTFMPVNGSVSTSYDQQMFPLMVEEEEGNEGGEYHKNVVCHDKIPTVFTMGVNEEKKSKSKKVEGQPSKNLMAERRRRKRLNDRLSMLRSIVPKISKMDRTSILGDTIDYMKELMEKIQDFKEQDIESNVDRMKLVSQVTSPPKFDVERGDIDTRMQICCATKPGLLLSTLNTLEAFGLDIQQCVISCFNDFSLQASCSEVCFINLHSPQHLLHNKFEVLSRELQSREHRSMIGCEEMKQILFRKAGYGGRCL